MKNKTYRFAAVAAVLLAFCLVFMAPVGAETVEVSSSDNLQEKINGANPGDTIILVSELTVNTAFTIDKNLIIDLNGNTLSVSTGGNYFKSNSDVTIKNGYINIDNCIASGDCIFGIGGYSDNAKLTLNTINLVGKDYSSAYTIFYVYNTDCELKIIKSVFTLENDLSEAGGVIKGKSGTTDGTIMINDSEMNFKSAQRGLHDGTVTLTNSELTIVDGGNAINQCELVIDNSKVTITNPNGRGITVQHGDVVIKGNSEVTITGSTEASIRYKDNTKSIKIQDNAKLDVETIVTDTNGENNPLTLDELGYCFVVDGTGVSISNGDEEIIPTSSQPTTSSSSGTPTPGAYYNYPRTTENGGLVEFGTSKVVKSVTLPAGSSGKVNLHIDSIDYWPLAVDSEFTFDISVENLGAGTSYISFKIAESKLSALNITAADIGVYHNVDGEWVKLTVTYKIEEGDVAYTAETDSFSPFKLVVEAGAASPAEEAVTSSEPVTPPTETPDVPGTDLPEIPGVQDEPEGPSSPAPLAAVIAALGAAVVLRRK